MEAFPGGTHRGRAFFNTTYLNLSSAPEFSKIDLHIKGDPYWFGSPNTIRDDLPENTWYANYELGSNCFFSSHVVISGSVKISDDCFFGVNSTIRDNINIGKACIIGAGSIVLKSLKDKSVIKAPSSILSNVSSDKLKKI